MSDESLFDGLSDEDNPASEQKRGFDKSMSVTEVALFLEEQGIPSQYCTVFQDNYIDGSELLNLTESDVKSMVPPIGLVKKIVRILSQLNDEEQLPTAQIEVSTPSSLAVSPVSSELSAAIVDDDGSVALPTHWRPEVESCIQDKSFSDSARNDIVRTVVSLLFSKYRKPSRAQCDDLARKLILKYPFARDGLGNGYQSWSDKMVERVRNVIKSDKKKSKRPLEVAETSTPKRKSKKVDDILQRYPIGCTSVNHSESSETLEQHKKAISAELSKSKPRDTVLLPLMKYTYSERRMMILGDNNEEKSVKALLQMYPALSSLAVIEQEMELVLGSSIKAHFISLWNTKFVPAIITYAEKSTKKSVADLLLDFDETDDASRQVAALKILSECLEKGVKHLCYLYEEYPTIETVDSACRKKPSRTQPRIAAFIGEGSTQFMILCEHIVLYKVPSLHVALYITFVAYYCFNLEYPPQAKHICSFFQDFILEKPSSAKKSASYLAVSSDIKRCL